MGDDNADGFCTFKYYLSFIRRTNTGDWKSYLILLIRMLRNDKYLSAR